MTAHLPPDPTSPQARAAEQAVRSLLDGNPLSEGLTPACLGPWAETVQLLQAAYAQGGADAVHRTFVALARQSPGLVNLLAGAGDALRTVWTVADLYAADFPPPRFLVPDLVPSGLTILAGRPKLGKSWLALQVAAAVGTGGRVLGERAERGRVLFLALEDTPRRLKDRLLKQEVPAGADITFHTAWEPLAQQGIADLMLAAASGFSLIVVDTFRRALGRADQLDATDMTLLLSSLQRVATRYDLALLLVDHHRKSNQGVTGPVDDIFGSTAKAGVVDATLGLYKQRGEPEAVLKITGRDLCERELAVRWEAQRFVWEAQGDAQEVELTARRQEVLNALKALGRAQLRDLADATEQERSNLFRRLQALVKSGAVTRHEEHGQVFYTVQ